VVAALKIEQPLLGRGAPVPVRGHGRRVRRQRYGRTAGEDERDERNAEKSVEHQKTMPRPSTVCSGSG